MTQPYNGILPGSFPDLITGPSPGELVTANSVGNIAQGAANQDLYLETTKAALAGATFTGPVIHNADWTLDGGAGSLANTTFLAGIGSRIAIGLNARWNRYVRRLTDADHTINCADGGVIILATPTAARTITIEQATDTDKVNFDTIEFWLYSPSANPLLHYEIKREGSGNFICRMNGFDGGGNQMQGLTRVHLEGGVWRLTGGIGLSALGADA